MFSLVEELRHVVEAADRSAISLRFDESRSRHLSDAHLRRRFRRKRILMHVADAWIHRTRRCHWHWFVVIFHHCANIFSVSNCAINFHVFSLILIYCEILMKFFFVFFSLQFFSIQVCFESEYCERSGAVFIADILSFTKPLARETDPTVIHRKLNEKNQTIEEFSEKNPKQKNFVGTSSLVSHGDRHM